MPPPVGLPKKALEVAQGMVDGVDPEIVGDIVAVVFEGGGVEGQQPDGRHPELLKIVELPDQAADIPDAVAVGVVEGLDVQLIDDRVAVPQGVVGQRGFVEGHGYFP